MITRLCRQDNRSNQRWTCQQKMSALIPVRCTRIISQQTRMGVVRFAAWILCLFRQKPKAVQAFPFRLKCSKQWASEQPLYPSQTLIKPCELTAQSSPIHDWSLWRPPVLKAGSMTSLSVQKVTAYAADNVFIAFTRLSLLQPKRTIWPRFKLAMSAALLLFAKG